MYIVLIATLLLILAILEDRGLLDKRISKIIFFLLFLFIVFRYPIGNDVYTYETKYDYLNIHDLKSHEFYGRSNFILLLFALIKGLGGTYNMFVFVSGLIMTSLVFLTIYKNTNRLMAASFILMASGIYQVYLSSTMRQCFAMAFFFFGYFNFLKNNKYLGYVIYSILSVICHEAGYLCFIFLLGYILLDRFDFLKSKITLGTFSGVALIMAIFADKIFSLVYDKLGYFKVYLLTTSPDYIGIALRIILFLIIFMIYKNVDENKKHRYYKSVYLYFAMTLIYCAFSWVDSISRVIDFYVIVELVMVPNMINDTHDNKNKLIYLLIILAYIAINYVMMVEDINQTIRYYHFTFDFIHFPFSLVFPYLFNSIHPF